jgi:hypothetical protein
MAGLQAFQFGSSLLRYINPKANILNGPTMMASLEQYQPLHFSVVKGVERLMRNQKIHEVDEFSSVEKE